MRYGDYIVVLSMTLNGSASFLYLVQGYWLNAFYWACAFGINLCILNLK